MTPRIAAALLTAGLTGIGCEAHTSVLQPAMPALGIGDPAGLDKDHFLRDRSGGVSEEGLRAILEKPVRLDLDERLGVVQVSDSYRLERKVPLVDVPAELTRSLDAAGLFRTTCEVSTDWPVDGDLAGLRELAARYHSGYLLLYRHRFVDESYTNGWAWLYLTLVGAIVAPSRTLDTAGVLEATLFDVRTGIVLFTVYERVRARSDETPWHEGRKLYGMQMRLLHEAAGKLAEQVVSKIRYLAVARS